MKCSYKKISALILALMMRAICYRLYGIQCFFPARGKTFPFIRLSTR